MSADDPVFATVMSMYSRQGIGKSMVLLSLGLYAHLLSASCAVLEIDMPNAVD